MYSLVPQSNARWAGYPAWLRKSLDGRPPERQGCLELSKLGEIKQGVSREVLSGRVDN